MKFSELQSIVLIEAICLMLILIIGIAAFKRWRNTLIVSTVLATVAFFSAWSNIMAFASTLVYGSASTLLWWQTEDKNALPKHRRPKYVQNLVWGILAAGVATLILNNLHNIILYLG